MSEKSEIDYSVKQEFSVNSPVVDLIKAVDYIINSIGIAMSSSGNPSVKTDPDERVAGLTNTYLKPTRIGRKAVIGNTAFFYGRKFDLLPAAYEIVSFDAPVDIFSFVENRIRETLTDYMSIQREIYMLNVDIKDGVIADLAKIGFDDEFSYLSHNAIFTFGDLSKIIHNLLDTSL